MCLSRFTEEEEIHFYVYYYYSYNNLPNYQKVSCLFLGTMSLALKKCILNFCVCHNIHVPSLFVYIFIQVKKKENYEQISLI